MEKITQQEKILNFFKFAEWVCTSHMYRENMSNPGARIQNLKKKGYVFERRICKKHNHDSSSIEWKLCKKN